MYVCWLLLMSRVRARVKYVFTEVLLATGPPAHCCTSPYRGERLVRALFEVPRCLRETCVVASADACPAQHFVRVKGARYLVPALGAGLLGRCRAAVMSVIRWSAQRRC